MSSTWIEQPFSPVPNSWRPKTLHSTTRQLHNIVATTRDRSEEPTRMILWVTFFYTCKLALRVFTEQEILNHLPNFSTALWHNYSESVTHSVTQVLVRSEALSLPDVRLIGVGPELRTHTSPWGLSAAFKFEHLHDKLFIKQQPYWPHQGLSLGTRRRWDDVNKLTLPPSLSTQHRQVHKPIETTPHRHKPHF